MNSSSNLHEILDLIAKKMQVDFEESAAIQHRASKGTVRERDLQRDFLQKYLSGSARVAGSGELVSADGQVSGQCDLMIVDLETPPLWKKEDYAIVPVECCLVVVEVKSDLTTEELRKSWAAARRVKSLPRTAFLSNPLPIAFTRTAYGRTWEHATPVRHIVFAYNGARLDPLAKEMSILANQDTNPAIGIDAVCVLNRGIVSWQQPGTSAIFQRQLDSMVFASSTTPGNVLLFMVTALNDILSSARYNDKFDLKAYIKDSMGDVDSWWRAGDHYAGIPVGDGKRILRKVEE